MTNPSVNITKPGTGGNSAPIEHVITVDARIGTLTARALDQPREDRTRPPEPAFPPGDGAVLLTTGPSSKPEEVMRVGPLLGTTRSLR